MKKIKIFLLCFALNLALNSCGNENNKKSIENVKYEVEDTTEIVSEDDSFFENENEKTSIQITFNDFKNSIVGKSTDEVKKIYGIPCDAQEIMDLTVWYYGRSICEDNTNSIIIINEDTQKEVKMVQIQFRDNSVLAVNSY